MSRAECIERLVVLLRTAGEDLERLNLLSSGQETSRAAQNVKASLEAIRRELAQAFAGDEDAALLLEGAPSSAVPLIDAIPPTVR